MVANEGRMEYIDSELAKRRRAEEGLHAASSSSLHSFGTGNGIRPDATRGDLKPSKTDVAKPAAALGKLVEVDLGEEARQRNEERTKRELRGEQVDDEIGKKPPKVRLGRDGKPWRGRKRRNSEDVRRDKLVEDVLKESRREFISMFDLIWDNIWVADTLQWNFMRNLLRVLRMSMITKRRMIGLQRLSNKNSWMLWLSDDKKRQLLPPLQAGQAKRKSRRDQNLVEAEMLGLR